MNIGTLLPRHARYRKDHCALVVGDQRLSFGELNKHVNQLANALLNSGIQKGEKIATLLPNCLELMVAYWACAKTGIVIVPGSTLLLPGGLITLINDSDTRLILADQSFAQTLEQILEQLPEIERDAVVLTCEEPSAALKFRGYQQFTAAASTEKPAGCTARR